MAGVSPEPEKEEAVASGVGIVGVAIVATPEAIVTGIGLIAAYRPRVSYTIQKILEAGASVTALMASQQAMVKGYKPFGK